MRLGFIKEQINWVDNWTLSLISDLDEKDCALVQNLGTSINWEIGHIIISKYFHSIQSILNKKSKLLKEINDSIRIDDLFKYYFAGSNPLDDWEMRPNREQLVHLLQNIDQATKVTLEKINEQNLNEPTEVKNPIAKTKYGALTFSFKHQMWHNGQIAMIKRIIKSNR